MKVAFLIIAHDQPAHLKRLIRFLSSDWGRIFVHIDKKVDIAAFREGIEKHKNIIFLGDKERVSINWAGYSQVEATLNLLDASLNCGEHFDRFCLLSGSDFPVKPLRDIKEEFDSKKEFMSVDMLLDGSGTKRKFVSRLHFMDSALFKAIGWLPKIPRKVYAEISLYHGCALWALTEGCIKYIVEFLQDNDAYIAFCKHTLSSDEIFFTSIVKKSPFAENITHDFEKSKPPHNYISRNEHGCHYIDWHAAGVSLPKILNESDADNLLHTAALFARKFREGNSDRLLQIIEKSIGR